MGASTLLRCLADGLRELLFIDPEDCVESISDARFVDDDLKLFLPYTTDIQLWSTFLIVTNISYLTRVNK